MGVEELRTQLVSIQSWLLDMGSVVAVQDAETSAPPFEVPAVDTLESWIDAMDSSLPPLRNFILPVRPSLLRQA